MSKTSILDISYQCVIESKGLSDKELILNSDTVFDKLFTNYDFNDYVDYFALITHDRDFNEIAELEREHIHLVIELFTPRTKSKILKLISNVLNISETRISIRVSKSRIYANQYLIHLNDIDKAQYAKEEVKTNNRNKFQKYLDSEPYSDIMTPMNLINLCHKFTMFEILNEIGLANYNKYRNTIKDIKAELKEIEKEHGYKIPF